MSLINDMIDKATGYKPSEKPQVLMKCPECKREKSIFFDPESMPAGTVVIDNCCPDCGIGCKPTELYFDANGNEIFSKESEGA